MLVTPIKTKLIEPGNDLLRVISETLPTIPERSVLIIATKAFSFAEKRLLPKQTNAKEEKWKLVRQEAEYYLEPNQSKYQIMFTIKGNWMFANAGIDESNSAGHYSLWPQDPQTSINTLWHHLRQHYNLTHLGLIMTDSHAIPLNWGVVGHGIVYCGFKALKNYIGTTDLHGREMQMEKLSLVQSLAAAGVMEMGEGNEQQPLALITNIKQTLEFQNRPPSKKEIALSSKVALEDDAFAPFITQVPWKKGKSYESG